MRRPEILKTGANDVTDFIESSKSNSGACSSSAADLPACGNNRASAKQETDSLRERSEFTK
jgi:hypothetical protein